MSGHEITVYCYHNPAEAVIHTNVMTCNALKCAYLTLCQKHSRMKPTLLSATAIVQNCMRQLPAPGVCGVYGTPGVIGLNATGDGVPP